MVDIRSILSICVVIITFFTAPADMAITLEDFKAAAQDCGQQYGVTEEMVRQDPGSINSCYGKCLLDALDLTNSNGSINVAAIKQVEQQFRLFIMNDTDLAIDDCAAQVKDIPAVDNNGNCQQVKSFEDCISKMM